MRRQIY